VEPVLLLRQKAINDQVITWLEAGPPDGSLMLFIHGWPEIGLLWRRQLEHFARLGWRCIAPDLRGFGASTRPAQSDAYELRHIVADLVGLHTLLGGRPAIWVGHDWGSPIVSAIAAHHRTLCRGVVLISIPYFPLGFALANLVPLVDRKLYPLPRYPYGQWDYYRFYQEHPEQAAQDYEADIAATLANLFRAGSVEAIGQIAASASVRAHGGRFGSARRAPDIPRDPSLMSQADFDTLVRAFQKTGFQAADSLYLNDESNITFAAEAAAGGRLEVPVLFVNGAWDPICDTTRNRLGEPMRAACDNLEEVSLDGGHWLMLEHASQVNDAITHWMSTRV
jgi:pimeloyl-ACP methyl ester carboxylesterase